MLPISNKALRTEIISFIVFYLLVCIFILAYSPTVILYVGHDVSPVIDGTWRIENHQIPHKDFPSILGYGYLMQQYLFLQIFHYNFIAFAVSSLTITTVVFLIFLSFYAYEGFIKNTSIMLRVYLFLILVSLGLGQYHFGIAHTLVTYANLYNRYSFLCLFVLFIQFLLLKNTKVIDTKLVIRLLVAGLLINYLLFVKLTYFAVALGFLTMCLFLSVVSFKIYFRLLLISLLIFAIVLLITKVDFLSILQDYRTISSARGKTLTDPTFIRSKFLQYYNIAFLLSLLLLAVEMFRKKVSLKFILLIGFVGVCAILIQFTNWGSTDIVMLSFVPVVFILLPDYTRLLSFKIFLVVSCFFIFKNMRSIYYLSKAKDNKYTELKSKYLSGFYTNFTETGSNENYATRVVSGVALIDKNKTGRDKVFSFSFDNPFPFLTHTVPPKQVPIVWQFATTYTYDVYTDPKLLFGDVDLLLIPKALKAESATEMMTLYGNTVKEHYSIIDNNGYWTLYRKIKPL